MGTMEADHDFAKQIAPHQHGLAGRAMNRSNSVEPRPQGVVDTAAATVTRLIECAHQLEARLLDVGMRLDGLGDRLYGVRPPLPTAAEPSYDRKQRDEPAESDSALKRLSDRLDHLAFRLDSINEAISVVSASSDRLQEIA